MKLGLVLTLALIFFSTKVEAQLKSQLDEQPIDARNTMVNPETASAGFLGNLFAPNNFKMHHSYSMTVGSFGGQTSSLGMYTNTMLFKLSEPLMLRVNTGIAHQPFGGGNGVSSQGAKLMHGAELIYAPSQSFRMSIGYSNNPFYSAPSYFPGSFNRSPASAPVGSANGAFGDYGYGGDQ